MKRKNVVIGLIGANRTGKTVTEFELAQNWKYAKPSQKIIGYDPQRQLTELIDFHINPDEKNWALHIWKKCTNSLIVMDDYKSLVPNYIPTPGMRQMFIDRCYHNNDYLYSCHSPGNIMDMLTEYTTHYYIFHTKNTEGKFKDKMPNSELCIGASRAVNKYVSLYGLGKHPKDPDFRGQRFPYIIVNTESQKLTAVNMHQKLEF